jgi:chromosome segregation ATPase
MLVTGAELADLLYDELPTFLREAQAQLTEEKEHFHSHYDAALTNWQEVLARAKQAEANVARLTQVNEAVEKARDLYFKQYDAAEARLRAVEQAAQEILKDIAALKAQKYEHIDGPMFDDLDDLEDKVRAALK